MPRHLITFALACAATAVCGLTATTADAATIGYWRFGDDPANTGFLEDSSGNANDLVAYDNPTQTSAFFSPVPATGASNSFAAALDGSNDVNPPADPANKLVDKLRLTEGTAGNLPTDDFTVEAFVSIDDVSQFNTILSQFDGAASQRAWRLFINNSPLNMQVDASGNNTSGEAGIAASGISLNSTDDFYIAASVEFVDADSGGTANDAQITFYVQNLTTGDPLQTSTDVVNNIGTSLFNSNAAFTIGGQDEDIDANKPFVGDIDEVRLSDTVLSQSELLIVPEPASLALVGFGGLVMLTGRRRRA